MIRLPEQYGYKRSGYYEDLTPEQKLRLEPIKTKKFCRRVSRKGGKETCVCIDFNETKGMFHFETSYFIGVDWINPEQALYVQPKMNKETVCINYQKILFDALQEPENMGHLDDLIHIDFDKPAIRIEQREDILSPFLLILYLQLLKGIVHKGLKKSYYPVTRNLEAKVKGKISIPRTVKDNLLKGRLTKTVCSYDEFGYNHDENKILKKALLFAQQALQGYAFSCQDTLQQMISYIQPAFAEVTDDIRVERIKTFKPNPMYKEYVQALKLALLILRRYSYNIHETDKKQYVSTPPFWIDMSLLFELYVFRKLREQFRNNAEVFYHTKVKRQELDFLINSREYGLKMVVDAKYKPYYKEGNVKTKDARQVAGYARLKKVYEELGMKNETDKNIDCLIIYPDQDPEQADSFNVADFKKEPINGYVNFYKIAIRLPEIGD